MVIWQADFYRRPLQSSTGEPLWELCLCDATGNFRWSRCCSQAEANSTWLAEQLQIAAEGRLPEAIAVFRPQSLSLMVAAGEKLGVKVEASRRTPALKSWLVEKAQEYKTEPNYTREPYEPLVRDRPPPGPLPEALWGDRWRFASVSAAYLMEVFAERAIRIRHIPEELTPVALGLPSNAVIPGVVLDGGRQSMKIAQWLQEASPVAIDYNPGPPNGLILEAGLVDRWIIATFEDTEVAEAGQTFQQRKQATQGLHFLLIQPDNSGMTYSGFWLLQNS